MFWFMLGLIPPSVSLFFYFLFQINCLDGRLFQLSVIFRSFSVFDLCCYQRRHCNCIHQQFELCIRSLSSDISITGDNCIDGIKRTNIFDGPSAYDYNTPDGIYSVTYTFDTRPVSSLLLYHYR